jgi:hypothetical protein
MNDFESQNKLIKNYLEKGNSLTSLQALNLFGCLRLGARIHDLRHNLGLSIKTIYEQKGRKRYAVYSLEK